MIQVFDFDGGFLAPQPDETMFQYWLSFAPVAPYLGVEYRPAKLWGQIYQSAPQAAEDIDNVAKEPLQTEVSEISDAPSDLHSALSEAQPASAPQESDLTMIKGIGPKLQDELNAIGLFTVAQLATYDEAQVADLCAAMTAFKDRPLRDDWVGQAKALSQR